jgi:phosphatidylethanolamine/phosphatidyl-N-methylethanolamine N-methyltransferase
MNKLYKSDFINMIWDQVLQLRNALWLRLQSLWLTLYKKNKYAKAIDTHLQRYIHQPHTTVSFLKALIQHPAATGAILPSSKYLAKTMASYIPLVQDSFIVELGAGTGVITKALLDHGIAAKRIIAIEYVPELVNNLKKRFPDITIIEGNALHLTQLLKDFPYLTECIISGLPLRSLSDEVRVGILKQIPTLLPKQGRYIQFTYDITSRQDIYPKNYHLIHSKIVWFNIPPAKIEVFDFV